MRFPVNPGRFLDEIHMHERLHSSLGYLTPAEFKPPHHRTHPTGRRHPSACLDHDARSHLVEGHLEVG